MMMEGLENGSELRKELERERRRIRDRQRRQSMSLEEREKHLARRRRNYQLRRQRAETARLNPAPPIQLQQTSISSVQLPLSNAATCVSDVSPHFDAAAAAAVELVGSNHGQERPMLDTRSCQSLEIPAHKLAILPGKVRLNRIKHLARVMNDPVGDGVAVGGMMKENGASDCLVSRGLRLNRVKRLARALIPAAQETVSQSHQSITEGFELNLVILRDCRVEKKDDCNSREEHHRCRKLVGKEGQGYSELELHDDEKSHLIGLDFDIS